MNSCLEIKDSRRCCLKADVLLALARLALVVEATIGSFDRLAATACWFGLCERVGLGKRIGLWHRVGCCESGESDW